MFKKMFQQDCMEGIVKVLDGCGCCYICPRQQGSSVSLLNDNTPNTLTNQNELLIQKHTRKICQITSKIS